MTPAARKPAARKPTAKKPAAKKPTTKKPAAKKPTTKKPAAKKPTTAKRKTFPFLFFGASPGDWYEGASCGHLYLLCFDGALAAEARLAVADAAAIGPLEPLDWLECGEWLWGELEGNTWAQFLVGPSSAHSARGEAHAGAGESAPRPRGERGAGEPRRA
jgi:hypothetical protein